MKLRRCAPQAGDRTPSIEHTPAPDENDDCRVGDYDRLAEFAASLLFAVVKSALFTRERRSLFRIYADEMQNFVVRESGVESVLSEAPSSGWPPREQHSIAVAKALSTSTSWR